MSKKPMIVGKLYHCEACDRYTDLITDGVCKLGGCTGVLENNPVVTVMFRKGRTKDGDVAAIMPLLPFSGSPYYVTCYARTGQHGGLARGYIDRTRPATEIEYAPLLKELTSAPYFYRFRIVKRWPKHGTPMEG